MLSTSLHAPSYANSIPFVRVPVGVSFQRTFPHIVLHARRGWPTHQYLPRCLCVVGVYQVVGFRLVCHKQGWCARSASNEHSSCPSPRVGNQDDALVGYDVVKNEAIYEDGCAWVVPHRAGYQSGYIFLRLIPGCVAPRSSESLSTRDDHTAPFWSANSSPPAPQCASPAPRRPAPRRPAPRRPAQRLSRQHLQAQRLPPRPSHPASTTYWQDDTQMGPTIWH